MRVLLKSLMNYAAAGSFLLASISFANADVIKIATIMSVTGPYSDFGVEALAGTEFAVDVVNAEGLPGGHTLELLVEDTQAKADLAVVAFNKLVDLEGVEMIISGVTSSLLAMAPLATRKQVVIMNGLAQTDSLAEASPYLFNTVPLNSDEMEVIARFAAGALYKKRAALLFEHSVASSEGAEVFKRAFIEGGGEVVAEQSYPLGETNFRPYLSIVGEAEPDVMFTVLFQNQVQAAEQMEALGLDFDVVGGSFFNRPALIESPAADGWYHTQLRIDAPAELKDRFKAEYGRDMGFIAQQYYNCTVILVEAIKKMIADGKELTGENARETLLSMGAIEGLSGPIEFTTNTASMGIGINRIEGGKSVFFQEMK